MNVELRHLRALVALAESETFTTAAAVLRTTQPTLSRTITQLEELTGVRLVERTTREMSFTPAGRQLAATARELLGALDGALAELGHAEAPLRLGWAWAGLGRHTVPLVQEWKRTYAETIELSRPRDPVEALRRNDIDAALVRRSPPSPEPLPGLAMTSLFTEKLVAAIAVDDPRADKNTVTLTEMTQDPVAVCATAPTVTSHLWDHTGDTPTTISVANTDEWLTRISVGDAVGVTAEATTYHHQVPDVAYRPIEDSPPVEVALTWPATTPHPRVHAFAQFARDYFATILSTTTPPLILDHSEPAEEV
ncbi:LysR family transcriptional regulator [Saccharopolyspora rhizosphaerae]|uniref:LysR family transcriptional regulator n=1 Tax=Saccharopolyspora rhizosphaerae TaxID=2492662 RepID=A0A3R8QI28_9PSEU|nr:LysR family transcriptional regulator [Saccharopolyspora rhizosphaerae]RRO13012.1 LysR family transcriptional regulator [Saccharopolyspora rhizosphaerae]